MSVCLCTYMYRQVLYTRQSRVGECVFLHTYMCMCEYMCKYMCICVFMYVCVCVCMYMYMYCQTVYRKFQLSNGNATAFHGIQYQFTTGKPFKNPKVTLNYYGIGSVRLHVKSAHASKSVFFWCRNELHHACIVCLKLEHKI